MINDSLIKIGEIFDKDKKDVKRVTDRITKHEPIIEKTLDRVGVLYDYTMEFYAYGEQSVKLDIRFFPKYKDTIYG